MVEIVEVVLCTISVVKRRSTYHFIQNAAYFVLEIELLLTVLCNFEREAALNDTCREKL